MQRLFFKNKIKNGVGIACDDLNIGDSDLIEFSLKDPSVARVVDKCYMQKYKGKYAK